jgi:bifunctional DNA-binding transcriptional regulator/antitoxin component of YhaV-PrlF toxin-antitoxin module
MLAKLTSKNQITLPKAVVDELGTAVEYFEVRSEEGRVILTPVRISRADAVRTRLAAMGLSEKDVEDARAWARKTR